MTSAPVESAERSPLLDGERVVVDGLELRVRTSSRRKRLGISVESDTTLVLHAPESGPRAEAERFVRAHRRWIVEKSALRERTRPLNSGKRLLAGETFRYLGRAYRLALSDDPRGTPVRLRAGRLVMPGDCAAEPQRGRQVLIDWYCRVGQSWVAGRLQPWAARIGVPEPRLDVRDLGDRWGAYRPPGGSDPAGQVSLGWPLFQLPMPLIDYVVAHELAHTKVSGHGTDFWRLLSTALPEYARRRAELDELGRRMWMGDVEGLA